MCNVEFRNLYCLSDIGILKNSGRWVRNVECMGMKVILKRFDWKRGRRESIQEVCVNMGG